MQRSTMRVAIFSMASLIAGCAHSWKQVQVAPPVTYPERQQFQIWTGDQQRTWHAVQVDDTTVSGIPFIQPPTCDSCRVVLARVQVDSLRIGSTAHEPFGTLLLVLAAATSLGLFAWLGA